MRRGEALLRGTGPSQSKQLALAVIPTMASVIAAAILGANVLLAVAVSLVLATALYLYLKDQ